MGTTISGQSNRIYYRIGGIMSNEIGSWEKKMQMFKIGIMLSFLGLVTYLVFTGGVCIVYL